MLNPGFTAEVDAAYGRNYSVPSDLYGVVLGANSEFVTGAERRLQSAYGDELWGRLGDLGVDDLPWDRLRVLDACCGTGFLSYHLLDRVEPRRLTMLDVSAEEVSAAEALIARSPQARSNVETRCADLASTTLAPGSFDVVLGNSFLHHFPAVPDVLASVYRLLRPAGLFVGLHEPAPAALAWESGELRQIGAYFLARSRYLNRIRYPGPEPVRQGTTDVWIFDWNDLSELLQAQGFTEVRVLPRYLLRPFVVAALSLHLDDHRPRLSRFGSLALRAAVRADSALRGILPATAFGGVSFVARRPA